MKNAVEALRSTHLFTDRREAGKQLARVLRIYAGADTLVLALPRGGVVLGREVADDIYAPLDVLLVKKIGYPSYEEYAIGAVVEGQPAIYDFKEVASLPEQWLRKAEQDARSVMRRRRKLYFDGKSQLPSLHDRTVIIVDDGIATGLTMEAAVRAVRMADPLRLIVAAPVASHRSVKKLQELVDHVVILDNPENFLGAVGNHYKKFEQVNDDEVRALLKGSAGGKEGVL